MTGAVADPEELRDPDYWVRHVREAVRFADGVAALAGAGVTTFLEVGPDAVLTAMGRDCVTDEDAVALVPVLRAGRDEPTTLLTALADPAHPGRPGGLAGLVRAHRRPHRSHCRPTPSSAAATGSRHHRGDRLASVGLGAAGHPLLGASVSMAEPARCCSPAGCPWTPTRGWPTTRSPARCCCPAPASSNSPCTPGATWASGTSKS